MARIALRPIHRLFNLRRDLLIAVALPLLSRVLSITATELRRRRDDSRVADRLDQVGALSRRLRRIL